MSTLVMPKAGSVVPAVQVGMLRAEYTLAKAQASGEWVAVGTVRSLQSPSCPPAWILVGLGDSASEAVEDLRRQLERKTQ